MAKLHLILDVEQMTDATRPNDPLYFANGVLHSSFAGQSVKVDKAIWKTEPTTTLIIDAQPEAHDAVHDAVNETMHVLSASGVIDDSHDDAWVWL